MDRIASLRVAAQQLRVGIYRTLPFNVRASRAVLAVADFVIQGFGQAIGAVFLQRGVTGIPDPGPRWNPASTAPARTLPRGYLADLGHMVFAGNVRAFRNPELVEDAMVEVMTKFTMHPDLVREGSDYSVAKNLVYTAVKNAILNKLKTEGRAKQRHKSIFDTDDEDGGAMELRDPSALDSIDDFVDASQLREIKQKVRHILPWAPGYIDMLMDGHNDREIIGDPQGGRPSLLAKELGLDTPYLTNPKGQPMTIAMWSNNWKPRVWEAVKEALR